MVTTGPLEVIVVDPVKVEAITHGWGVEAWIALASAVVAVAACAATWWRTIDMRKKQAQLIRLQESMFRWEIEKQREALVQRLELYRVIQTCIGRSLTYVDAACSEAHTEQIFADVLRADDRPLFENAIDALPPEIAVTLKQRFEALLRHKTKKAAEAKEALEQATRTARQLIEEVQTEVERLTEICCHDKKT